MLGSVSQRLAFGQLLPVCRKKKLFSFHSQAIKKSRKILVVGSGAIGLRTALELLQRNNDENEIKVVVQSPRHPILDTYDCSMGAGGLWMPFRVDDNLHRVDRWALQTFDELYPLAINKDCDLVELLPAISLFRYHHGEKFLEEYETNSDSHVTNDMSTVPPSWTKDRRLEFQHLTIEMLAWQNTVMRLKIPPETELKEAGYLHAWLFKTPIVECVKMLQHYLDRISAHSQTIDINLESNREYNSMKELCHEAIKMGCDTVINCTGLGAKQLCSDDQVFGIRGILHHYTRKDCGRRPEVLLCPVHGQNNVHDAVITTEEPEWGSDTAPCYMIPRGDKLIIGGSCLLGDNNRSIRPEEHKRLIRNARYLGVDVDTVKPIGEWIGFRPYRKSIRCEIDHDLSNDSLMVVHNYGYGGSGWTLNVGAAKAAADMVLGFDTKL